MKISVDRRSVRVEASPYGGVDLIGMNILVVVRPEQGANPCHRKGKGSLAMFVSQGLVDPNQTRN